MGERIGLIIFRAFEPIDPLVFYGQKRHVKRMQFPNDVLTLAEAFPTIPPMRPYAPELTLTADQRVYKLRHELNPLMNAYHEWLYKMSVRKEILSRWVQRHKTWDREAAVYLHRLEQLHNWMIDLYFQRVQKRSVRLFREFQELHAAQDRIEERFFREHKTKRLEESQIFPFVYSKLLKNPHFHEVREPNEAKSLDLERARIANNRFLGKQEVNKAWHLRYQLADAIEKELEHHLRHDFRQGVDDRLHSVRQHYQTILSAFDQAWSQTWDRRDWFMAQEREAVVEQAELMPKQFKIDLKNPYRSEVKLPNQHDHYEVQQMHAQEDQRILRSELKREQDVRSRHEGQMQDQHTGQILEQTHFQKQRGAQEAYEHTRFRHAWESNQTGYSYTASTAIPRPPFAVASHDETSPVQRTLGIKGDPHAPERTNPLSIPVPAPFQRTLYNKAIDTQRHFDQNQEAMVRAHTDDIAKRFRAQWALQDYMEGQLQEQLLAARSQVVTDSPSSNARVQPLTEVHTMSPESRTRDRQADLDIPRAPAAPEAERSTSGDDLAEPAVAEPKAVR